MRFPGSFREIHQPGGRYRHLKWPSKISKFYFWTKHKSLYLIIFYSEKLCCLWNVFSIWKSSCRPGLAKYHDLKQLSSWKNRHFRVFFFTYFLVSRLVSCVCKKYSIKNQKKDKCKLNSETPFFLSRKNEKNKIFCKQKHLFLGVFSRKNIFGNHTKYSPLWEETKSVCVFSYFHRIPPKNGSEKTQIFVFILCFLMISWRI